MASAHEIPNSEAAEILAREKHVRGDVEWRNTATESVLYDASFVVLDESGGTIPGLTVELQYRRGRIRSECKFKFTIFTLKGTSCASINWR